MLGLMKVRQNAKKQVEHQNKRQPNPGSKHDGSPCCSSSSTLVVSPSSSSHRARALSPTLANLECNKSGRRATNLSNVQCAQAQPRHHTPSPTRTQRQSESGPLPFYSNVWPILDDDSVSFRPPRDSDGNDVHKRVQRSMIWRSRAAVASNVKDTHLSPSPVQGKDLRIALSPSTRYKLLIIRRND